MEGRSYGLDSYALLEVCHARDIFVLPNFRLEYP